MTSIGNLDLLAVSAMSRSQALAQLGSMIKKARKTSDPQATLEAAVSILQATWEARTLGFLAAMDPTYRWKAVESRDNQGDLGRPNAVLMVAGHPDLIRRVEAVVDAYHRERGAG